jgi:tetratricopeptide (TPR) repeat protein
MLPDFSRIRTQKAVRQAEGYLELDMPVQALESLRRVGPGTTNSAHAAYLEGEALRALQRYGEAIRPYLTATQAMPDLVAAWLGLAWCYKRTGKLERAIWSLEQSLSNGGDSEAIVHYNLACYWSLARRKDLAIDFLARALEIDADYRQLIDGEPDFDPIRGDGDFQSLVKIAV